jgi:CRISPR system Cascade subunit CasB
MTEPLSDRPRRTSRWDETIRRWWSGLQPGEPGGRGRGDRAALARLRRATLPLDALDEPAVFDLYRRLGFGAREAENRLPWVAAAAMVLAHVRNDEWNRSPARAVGRSNWDDKTFDSARVKPLRFQRLLAAREPEDVAREMRRLVALADRRINVGALGAAILDWNHPERGERMRARWAFDYHAAGDAAPDAGTGPGDASAPSPAGI